MFIQYDSEELANLDNICTISLCGEHITIYDVYQSFESIKFASKKKAQKAYNKIVASLKNKGELIDLSE